MALLFLLIGGGGLALAMANSVQRSPAMGFPIWLVYASMPLAGLLGLWHLATDIPALLRGEDEETETQRLHAEELKSA
jgi:TRAP-type C4-dicarboxylate transport system permease small subunit